MKRRVWSPHFFNGIFVRCLCGQEDSQGYIHWYLLWRNSPSAGVCDARAVSRCDVHLSRSPDNRPESVYNKIGKTYLFDIDFYHIKNEDQDPKYTMDAYHVGNVRLFFSTSLN